MSILDESTSSPVRESTRPGRLSLPVQMPLRRGLTAAFGEIVDFACSQVGLAASDPATAVHEYRKAVRRGRALLRLARELMGADAYAEIAGVLRTAHRATSAQRDRHVVLHTLAAIKLKKAAQGPAESVRASLGTDEPATGEAAAALLAKGAELLRPLPEALDKALPDKVTWRDIGAGLQETYVRALRNMHRTMHGGDDNMVHEWRKRTKELNYQVELLTEGIDNARGHTLRKRLSKLAEKLGGIMDLMVLEHYVQQHGKDSERAPLIAAIRAYKQKRLDKALQQGAKTFRHKPKRLVRDVLEASRAAHKLARSAARRANGHGKSNGVAETMAVAAAADL